MPSLQEIAHTVTGLMTVSGAVSLVAFVILRRNFDISLRLSLSLLAAGLIAIGAFQFSLALKVGGNARDFISILTIVAAAVATIASVFLARTAFNSHLISALHHRVEAHRRTLQRLRRSRIELEHRVNDRARELREYEKRLRIALRDSKITVFMQDPALRYVWVRNAPEGFSATDLIGKTDDEVLPPAAARAATTAKMKVIETGQDSTTELYLEPSSPGQRARYFEVTTEPYYGETGEFQGLLSVSVETTDNRHREELLKETLLEVSHRTKNQLSVLMSIARRLGATKADTAKFLPAFEARLRALSISQDVLVENDWASPHLERLVRAQLEPYLSSVTRRKSAIVFSGPDVFITPTAVQNLGLVFHELALNAFEIGVMRSPGGQIDISWDFHDEPACDSDSGHQRLEIRWKEIGASTPANGKLKSSFGQNMAHQIAHSALGGDLEIVPSNDGFQARLKIGSAAISFS
ncbi:MAG: PAS domain-containing protein [Alphaproteobacteria bacterium]|nr:PAS domain-containing protein [Alphaproteobacteria bacterium]